MYAETAELRERSHALWSSLWPHVDKEWERSYLTSVLLEMHAVTMDLPVDMMLRQIVRTASLRDNIPAEELAAWYGLLAAWYRADPTRCEALRASLAAEREVLEASLEHARTSLKEEDLAYLTETLGVSLA